LDIRFGSQWLNTRLAGRFDCQFGMTIPVVWNQEVGGGGPNWRQLEPARRLPPSDRAPLCPEERYSFSHFSNTLKRSCSSA
jgi:hypothetical protein